MRINVWNRRVTAWDTSYSQQHIFLVQRNNKEIENLLVNLYIGGASSQLSIKNAILSRICLFGPMTGTHRNQLIKQSIVIACLSILAKCVNLFLGGASSHFEKFSIKNAIFSGIGLLVWTFDGDSQKSINQTINCHHLFLYYSRMWFNAVDGWLISFGRAVFTKKLCSPTTLLHWSPLSPLASVDNKGRETKRMRERESEVMRKVARV